LQWDGKKASRDRDKYYEDGEGLIVEGQG